MMRASRSSSFNGFVTSHGNCFWVQCLSHAWTDLSNSLKEEIIIKDSNEEIKNTIAELKKKNKTPETCIYVRSGFGKETVHNINKEMSKKFPDQKVFLKEVEENEIILYGHLEEKVQFEHPFHPKPIMFNGNSVEGLSAETKKQRQQIFYYEYHNEDNFIVSMETKGSEKQLILLKKPSSLTVEKVRKILNELKKEERKQLQNQDKLQFPLIKVHEERQIEELLLKKIENKEGCCFGEVKETMKLSFQDKFIKKEEQCEITDLFFNFEPRKFFLNKQFWMILRSQNSDPYLIGCISKLGEKEKKKKSSICCTQ